MEQDKTIQEEILANIEAIERDETLSGEKNFSLRAQAIDDIEFHIIGRIDAVVESTGADEQMSMLKQYAERVKGKLEDVNTEMFSRLRAKISQESYRSKLLMDLIAEHIDHSTGALLKTDEPGYDDLDVFINGLLCYGDIPAETKDREAEMVFYQKTPARIIFELIKKAELKPADVFFDIGSGLGQVAILVTLLTSVTSTGIEFEPAFCCYAQDCATNLNVKGVTFVNTDARDADYSTGTVFFMYTPFQGEMLREVLDKLHNEAKKRQIKVFTYGPCTGEVARERWLIDTSANQNYLAGPGEFTSA